MKDFNLPSQPTSFIGRQAELAEIANRLVTPDCRMLTLTGPGGIGKTRLALEAAQLQVNNFSNAVYFVPLQPLTSTDFIVPAIAESLKFSFSGDQNPKIQLLDYLHEKHLFLVLDNFEHLLDGAELLAEILEAAPEVKILVTSRERLRLHEEWVFDVGGLGFPENEHSIEVNDYSAVGLFLQSARKVGYTPTDADSAPIVRICRLVGGMPLGIELAAAWARTLPCEQIVNEIERSLDILETPTRNVPLRHRTMRAVFEPTWQRLLDEERDVFMRLSVFRGGFSREAAERVAGASLRKLSALVDKSLVKVDAHGRYDLHDLLRQYGEGKLMDLGEAEATRAAHSAYYAAFLDQKWQPLRTERQIITLDEIEIEFENVRTAWQTMVEKRNTSELSKAVYPLWYYADIRTRYHEALPLFKQAEDGLRPAAGDAEVDRVIGQMLSRRGFFHISLGKPAEGRVLGEEGLAILQQGWAARKMFF